MKKFISALLVFALFFQLLPLNIVRAETLAITKQPVNVTVASGETAKTSVAATGDGLKYQWYYANKGATTFSKASITSATYTVEMTASRSGRRIYCVVTDESGNQVTSDTVTITMATPVKITKQPANITVASGETAKTSVTATGDGLKYQWYYANKGATTFSKASITSATYTVEMTASRSGRRIYCVITDKYGNKVTSNTVTLTVENPLKITKQPTNVTVASGETAKTSVTATGDGLKYQWYYANKGATTFSKASITSSTYSVEMNSTRAGRRVYCVITDQNGDKVTSDTVTLSMAAPLKITKQPTDVTVASGETATTSVTATGDGLKYQWYYANKGATTFSKASITSDTYTVEMTASRSGRSIYCVITDKYGNKVTSNTVTLNVPSLKITKQPADVTVASGKTATTSVTVTGDGLKYQWYYANKGATKFSKASITSATYSVEMTASRAGRRIYCVITDQYGNKVTSDTVTLNIEASSLKITKQPTDVTVANGKTATTSVTATGDGLKYQWYYANKGATKFSKASIVTDTYTVEMTASRSGRRIYCVITDQYGNTVNSDTVTLNMATELKIIQQPTDVTVDNGETATTSVTAEGDGLKYQWYYANKDATSFSKASIVTDTYTVEMTASRSRRRIYCVITDQYGQEVKSDVVTLSMTLHVDVPEGLEYLINRNVVSITGYTGSATHLIIPSVIEGYLVTQISDAFRGTDIVRIIIPNTVTTISSEAFADCWYLSDIDIPNSVTSIGLYAFYNCYALKNITLPNSISAIKSGLFESSGLESITIPSSVTSIETYSFRNTHLTSITIPSSVTSISTYAFDREVLINVDSNNAAYSSMDGILFNKDKTTLLHYPTVLTQSSYTVPSTVTSIVEYAFENCYNLTSISIPASVTFIDELTFTCCNNLTTIIAKENSYAHQWCLDWGYEDNLQVIPDIPDGLKYSISDGVATITSYAGNATQLVIPSAILGNPVTSIAGNAFSHLANLTKVTIPNSVTFIGEYAFCYCSSLTDVNIPNGIKTINECVFYQCTSLKSITLPNSVTSIADNAFGSCSNLASVTIPSSVSSIGTWAFSYCTSLQSISIPNGVTSISEAAFAGCRNLQSITLHDNISSIGQSAFQDCELLSSINIPRNVTYIGMYAFLRCSSLTNLSFADSVTYIDSTAFMDCSSLVAITVKENSYAHQRCIELGFEDILRVIQPVPEGLEYYIYNGRVGITGYTGSATTLVIPGIIENYPVTSIFEKAFQDCTTLNSITIPESVTSIGSYAFQRCSGLTSINIPYGVSIIPMFGFEKCTNLQSISLPNSVKIIGESAFQECSSLPGITLPSSITRIDTKAFSDCYSLASITIPSGMTSIGEQNFCNCTNLISVSIPNTVTEIGNNAFVDCINLKNISIPNSVTTIAPGAFMRCKSLTIVTIPNSVESIGFMAFASCNRLTTITIPNSVSSFGGDIFNDCPSLTTIKVEANSPAHQWFLETSHKDKIELY